MPNLYVIGVGPGDPELLTLKALRIIRDVPLLFVPKGREDGKSLALSIVSNLLDLNGKDIRELHFPMIKTKTDQSLQQKWDYLSKEITETINNSDAAFLTLGDPCFYSTFFYLYDRLLQIMPELRVEIIPGISSINASAARANISLALADEKIAILPATYTDNLKDVIERFDTIVLMKVHRVFDKVLTILNEMNITNNAVYISRAGMDDEKIFRNIKDIKETDLDYFSMVIVKK